MIANNLAINSLIGVGDVSIEFANESTTCLLIGANGIGKTKSLEAIFQALFFTSGIVAQEGSIVLDDKVFLFHSMKLDNMNLNAAKSGVFIKSWQATNKITPHSFPVVYLGSQQRGKR